MDVFPFQLPGPLRTFFAYFPLYTHPAITPPSKKVPNSPTLWILPPRHVNSDTLSSDVECLKWQAYLALRGLKDIAVRWDVHPDGALDRRLPNLHLPSPPATSGNGKLLPAPSIPEWVDSRLGTDPLEGYVDEAARDESRAWVLLLEEKVHAALVLSQPQTSLVASLFSLETEPTRPIETLLSPPPGPFSGLTSLIPPYGVHIPTATIELQYREAIRALSERLGSDHWFLGSPKPTALDALVFAYLHCILYSVDDLRIEVSRRANLVEWEKKVRGEVQAVFPPHTHESI